MHGSWPNLRDLHGVCFFERCLQSSEKKYHGLVHKRSHSTFCFRSSRLVVVGKNQSEMKFPNPLLPNQSSSWHHIQDSLVSQDWSIHDAWGLNWMGPSSATSQFFASKTVETAPGLHYFNGNEHLCAVKRLWVTIPCWPAGRNAIDSIFACFFAQHVCLHNMLLHVAFSNPSIWSPVLGLHIVPNKVSSFANAQQRFEIVSTLHVHDNASSSLKIVVALSKSLCLPSAKGWHFLLLKEQCTQHVKVSKPKPARDYFRSFVAIVLWRQFVVLPRRQDWVIKSCLAFDI